MGKAHPSNCRVASVAAGYFIKEEAHLATEALLGLRHFFLEAAVRQLVRLVMKLVIKVAAL